MGDRADTDEVLLARVRVDGDREAFGCLYERHAPAARRFARSLCSNEADADDITAEVFENLLGALRRGRGPSQLALPYLLVSIRNQSWRVARRRSRESAFVRTVSVAGAGCESAAIAESDVLRTAFATLPPEVQMLLWRTEVQHDGLDDAADGDRLAAHNVAVRRHRARRALGTAYLAQHAVPDGGLAGVDPECRSTLSDLAPLVRNRIGVRRRRRMEEHLGTCERCRQARQRLEHLNTRLRVHPLLPWTTWWAALTSAIKSHASSWLGGPAVTLAGSGALSMAVLVPTPNMLQHVEGTEPRSAPAAASSAREPGATTQDIEAGGRAQLVRTAPGPGRPSAEPNRSGIPTTMDTAAAAGALVGREVPISSSANDRDTDGIGGGRPHQGGATGRGNGHAGVTDDGGSAPARGSSGKQQSNGDDERRGTPNGEHNGSGGPPDNGNRGSRDNGGRGRPADGQPNGRDDGKGSGASQGVANGHRQLVSIANGNGPSSRAAGQDRGRSNRPGFAVGHDNGVGSGHRSAVSQGARVTGTGEARPANPAGDHRVGEIRVSSPASGAGEGESAVPTRDDGGDDGGTVVASAVVGDEAGSAVAAVEAEDGPSDVYIADDDFLAVDANPPESGEDRDPAPVGTGEPGAETDPEPVPVEVG